MERFFAIMASGLFFVCAVFASFSALAGERMEINKVTGEVRLVSDQPEWSEPTSEQRWAYDNPGKESPVDTKKVGFERTDFFHIITLSKYTKAWAWNGQKMVMVEGEKEVRGEEQFAFYLVFCVLGIGFMAVSMVVSKKRPLSDSAVVAFVVAAAAVAAAAVAVAAAAVAVAVAAFVAAVENSSKWFWIFAVIYQLLMLVIIFGIW